jgi:hypothetical protein
MGRTAGRKLTWAEPQWREYVAKLCRVRQVIREFYEFLCTQGLRADHLKPFVRAHDLVALAALRLEDVVVDQLGGESAVPGGAIAFARGRDGADHMIFGVRGKAKPTGTPLSREQWAEWGRRAKEARGLLFGMLASVRLVKGTSRHVGVLLRAIKALDAGRCKLDGLACDQHREWDRATRVFYGPDDALEGWTRP